MHNSGQITAIFVLLIHLARGSILLKCSDGSETNIFMFGTNIDTKTDCRISLQLKLNLEGRRISSVKAEMHFLPYIPSSFLKLQNQSFNVIYGSKPYKINETWTNFNEEIKLKELSKYVKQQLKNYCGDFSLVGILNITSYGDPKYEIEWDSIPVRIACTEGEQETYLEIKETGRLTFPSLTNGILDLNDFTLSVVKPAMGDSKKLVNVYSKENVLVFLNEFSDEEDQEFLLGLTNTTKWSTFTAISEQLLRSGMVSYESINSGYYMQRQEFSYQYYTKDRQNITLPRHYKMVDDVNLGRSSMAAAIFLVDPLKLSSGNNKFNQVVAIPVVINSAFILQGKGKKDDCSVLPKIDNSGAIIFQGRNNAHLYDVNHNSFSKAGTSTVFKHKMEYYEGYETFAMLKQMTICHENYHIVKKFPTEYSKKIFLNYLEIAIELVETIDTQDDLYEELTTSLKLALESLRAMVGVFSKDSELERKMLTDFIVDSRNIMHTCSLKELIYEDENTSSSTCSKDMEKWKKKYKKLFGKKGSMDEDFKLIMNKLQKRTRTVELLANAKNAIEKLASTDPQLRTILTTTPKTLDETATYIRKILEKLSEQMDVIGMNEDWKTVNFINTTIRYFVERVMNKTEEFEDIQKMAIEEEKVLQGSPGDSSTADEICLMMAMSMVATRKVVRDSHKSNKNPIFSMKNDLRIKDKGTPLTFRSTNDGIYVGRFSELLSITMWTKVAMCSCKSQTAQWNMMPANSSTAPGSGFGIAPNEWQYGFEPIIPGDTSHWSNMPTEPDQTKANFWPNAHGGVGNQGNGGFVPIIPDNPKDIKFPTNNNNMNKPPKNEKEPLDPQLKNVGADFDTLL